MPSWRSSIGLIAAVLPIAYCGGLVWYFVDMGGWDLPIVSNQLRPTIIGLGLIGLLFIAALAFKVWRTFGGSRPPADRDSSPRPPNALRSDETEEGAGPDVDAMIARYLAQRASADPSPAATGPAPSAKTTFGRRAARQ